MGRETRREIGRKSTQLIYSQFGFLRGISSPSVFYHPTREIRVVVHGGDFTFLGWRGQLLWARGEMENSTKSTTI